MRFNDGEDLQQYILQFERTIRDLKSTGARVEDGDAVSQLLVTLPRTFDTVVTALETLEADRLTMDFVKSRLLDFQTKRNMTSVEKSIESLEVPSAFGANGKKFVVKCYLCGKVGHKKSKCPENEVNNTMRKAHLADTEEETDEELDEESECFAFNTFEDSEEMVWILDSGATDHMTNEGDLITNKTILDIPKKISVAKKGVLLEANEIGDIELYS